VLLLRSNYVVFQLLLVSHYVLFSVLVLANKFDLIWFWFDFIYSK